MLTQLKTLPIAVLKKLFGGRWLYVRWLNASQHQLSAAQKSRSRAPSWLRERPAQWRATLANLAHQDLERERDITQEPVTRGGDHSSTSVIDKLNEPQSPRTVALTSVAAILPPPTPSQSSRGQTELYLGPIGSDRPDAQLQSPRQRDADIPLILIISCLMMIGLVMVYSSSIVRAGLPKGGVDGQPEFFFNHQILYMSIGIFLMFIVSRIPYQCWAMLASVMYLAGLVGLLLVFSPIGKTVNGAHRWINLGINIQPIEFTKFAWITLLCVWFGDNKQDMNRFNTFLIPALGLIPIGILLGFQPDFGSMIIVSVIFVITYLTAGGTFKKLIIPSMFVIAPASFVMYYNFGHIGERLKNFIKIVTDPYNVEYNLQQALVSFSSGRFWGVGLGQSSQKEYFLPEAHTDFILAIFGAEFGFIGVVILVGLYVAFLFRCLHIARLAPDLFGALIVTVSSLMLVAQAFINMSMAIGMLPTKGLTLPLISYGGSSLLITCFTLGVILNVSRRTLPTSSGIKWMSRLNLFNPLPSLVDYFTAHPIKIKNVFRRLSFK